MPVKRAAAFSGGGAKGMVQVGNLEVVLQEHNVQFDIVGGISVGALAAAMVAQNKFNRYKDLFFSLREHDIFTGSMTSPVNLMRIAFGRNHIYNNSPLWELIQQEIDPREFAIDVKIGVVDLISGKFLSYDYRHEKREVEVIVDGSEVLRVASVDDFVNAYRLAVLASTAIPVTFPPVEMGENLLVDGGVHMISPLGNLIDEEPTEVYVFNCESQHPQTISPGKKNILQVGSRSLELLLNRIVISDIREFKRINKNVKEAGNAGVILHNEKGKPYKHYRSFLFEPAIEMGDTLDFSERTQQMRYDHGVEIAKEVMKKKRRSGRGGK